MLNIEISPKYAFFYAYFFLYKIHSDSIPNDFICNDYITSLSKKLQRG